MRDYLGKSLDERVDIHYDGMMGALTASDALKSIRINQATYSVFAFGPDNGELFSFLDSGMLRRIMRRAKTEVGDMPGGCKLDYVVHVQLGPLWVKVPEEYWAKFV